MVNLAVLGSFGRWLRCGPLLLLLLAVLVDSTWGQSVGVQRQLYLNITGANVADLTNNAKFPNSPDQTDYLTTSFEAPINIAENFGTRCRGFVTAPLTGNYIFWVSSDDASTLFLSTDESPSTKTAIAWV